MERKENMNPESIKSLKEFNKKQIKTNIRIHLAFLFMIIIINLCLFNFIIVFQKQISEIKLKSSERKSSINQDTHKLLTKQNSIYHKLVNIFAISLNIYGNTHFSMIFEKSEEVKMVKNCIIDYKKIENPQLLLLYQGMNDSDDSLLLLNIISYWSNLLIIIESNDGNKLGFFFEESISPNNNGYFESESDRCFIISFSNKEKYDCLNNGINLEINKNSLFNIGNGDIIINHKFMTEGGIINFPFKSFDISGIKNNVFTEYNGEFEIYDIEIYALC